MIPTVIIVNDNNPELTEYANLFKKFTRVILRSSFEGEQLYSTNEPFLEGILLFGSSGAKVLARRDDYENITRDILLYLLRTSKATEQTKKYIRIMNVTSYLPKTHNYLNLSNEEKDLISEYVKQVYEL
jgi:hypothetical protein